MWNFPPRIYSNQGQLHMRFAPFSQQYQQEISSYFHLHYIINAIYSLRTSCNLQ